MKICQLSAILLLSTAIIACDPATGPEQGAVSTTITLAAPRITISGLYDGQLLEQGEVTIQYSLTPEATDNIAVLYIDNGDPQPLPTLQGEYQVTDLEPGVHALQIKEMNADFEPTGYFEQVNFIVQ